jgi:hypothetical protein
MRRSPRLPATAAPPPPRAAELFRLGQRLPELFAAADLGEKRDLLGRVFEAMVLDGAGVLRPRYRPPFAALSEAARQSNGSKVRAAALPTAPSFEPVRVGPGSTKKGRHAFVCRWWGGGSYRTRICDPLIKRPLPPADSLQKVRRSGESRGFQAGGCCATVFTLL